MRFTKKEKEQIYEAICNYLDLSLQGKTDRTDDEIAILQQVHGKMRLELKGF